MAQATFSVRMEDSLKKEFDRLCSDFGMSMSTAITVFAKAVVRERKIPFEISANVPNDNTMEAIKEFEEFKKNPKEYKSYSSFSELLDEVRNDV